MTVQRISATAVAILVLVCASHAAGAVVVYDENIDGDLPATGSPLPNFALDIGTNTVKGKVGTLTGHPFDFDSFAFTVPAGTQLVSGSVTMFDSLGNSADFDFNEWYLFAGSPNYEGGSYLEFVAVGSPDTYTFISTPLAANVYNLSAEGAGYSGNAPAFAEYTFSLVVAAVTAVPEPATLMMWGLILAGVPFAAKAFGKR